MPERWERKLDELRHMEMREPAIRERIERGPSVDPRSSRKNSLLAGIVAGAVVLAGIAALWQLDRNPSGIGEAAIDLPTLIVTFQSGKMIVNQPDEQIQRVDTTIVYGDAREKSFTSTVSESAHVDWVGVEDLTRFVPGPTVGSQIRFDADGENPRVLIGRPSDWPEFDRFTQIDQLPEEPGDYVLVFEATYAEGVARTARFVRIVAPRTMQLAVTTQGWDATADAYVDGARTDGLLSASWGEPNGNVVPTIPAFGPEAVVQLDAESPIILATAMSYARGGFFGEHDSVDIDAAMPLPFSDVESAPVTEGRYLLALEVGWDPGDGSLGGSPAALFLFPIEIVPVATVNEPSLEVTPSPAPVSPDAITIDIRRASQETGDPEAIARFGSQEQWMCPDGWDVVNPDGSHDQILFDCGQNDVFEAPVGTPINVAGDFATVNISTRLSGEGSSGAPADRVADLEAGTVVTYAYEVTWDDGSEASFWLLLTVGEAPPSDANDEVVVRIEGLGRSEQTRDWPVMTVTFRGGTILGCTEAFEWTRADLTEIDEVSGREGSILPPCSSEPRFVVPPRTPIVVIAEEEAEVFVTRTTTPLYTGTDSIGVHVKWPDGNAVFTAFFEVMYEEPVPRNVELSCPAEDQVEFVTPDGPRILPGGSAYIRGNMAGFQQTDVIEQMTREPGGTSEWDGVWQVVRDGSVIAAVEFGSLRGVACAGTGIGGA